MKAITCLLFFLPLFGYSQLITTYAGNGIAGLSGDGGLATDAKLTKPFAVNFSKDGDLLICEDGNIRKINAVTGIISTIAGDTTSVIGDGGPASSALASMPYSVCTDAAGNIYI